MQHTLAQSIFMEGVGLHSGAQVRLTIRPAAPDQGIVFRRTDVTGKNAVIAARWDNVVDTTLCTVIANKDNVRVGTIEHLMAALRGSGVDNALIEVDAAEVPIMDGSSAPFVERIQKAGTVAQDLPRRAIKVLKTVEVEQGGKTVTISPSIGCSFAGQIDYDHPHIGTQRFEVQLVNGNFAHELSEARTFGFIKDVEAMRAAGLARGGSLENAVVLTESGVANPEGLRFSDEFIRHKVLDAIGDLFLAGGPVLGAYEGVRAGHALNNQLLRKLFADETAWTPVDLYVDAGCAEDAVHQAFRDYVAA